MRLVVSFLLIILSSAVRAEYFAKVDAGGTVTQVIAASPAFIASGAAGDPSQWIETREDGSLNKNFASPGHRYDPAAKGFVAPKPTPNATLNPNSLRWTSPPQDLPPRSSPR